MNSGPCLDGLSLALSQINCLIADLTKKNFKSNVTELKNVRILNFLSKSLLHWNVSQMLVFMSSVRHGTIVRDVMTIFQGHRHKMAKTAFPIT